MPINAPIITSNGQGATASISLAEGIKAVTTVTATDADAGTVITYKIIGGKDAFRFQIDAATGALSFKTAPDFEAPTDSNTNAASVVNGLNTYEVIVSADDSEAGLPIQTDTQTILVTITDVAAVTINGTGGSDTMLGGASATVEGDTINGLAGADTIDGGGGADTMTGGADSDVYFVDTFKAGVVDTGDTIVENVGGGTADEIRSTVTYSMANLAAEVEKLTLLGTTNINATGNALANIITGNSGNNIIDGGDGIDTMAGGNGNDVYKVNVSGETVTENASEGTDRVDSAVNFTLGANIENLTLLVGASNGTGNVLANTITGNAVANVLRGNGGNDIINGMEGADTMFGGTGSDKYYVDNAGDVASEDSGGGIDIVYSKVSFTLGLDVENLSLTAAGNLTGTGNASRNIMVGFSDNNILSGGAGNDSLDGKAGDDTMIGGDGSDKFVVDAIGDVVTEGAGLSGDIDTVFSAVSYDISAAGGTNIENVTLSGVAGNSITGNASANELIGNAGGNTIAGGAGSDFIDGKGGIDVMSGGDGSDFFVVDHGGDTVTEGVGLVGDIDTVRSSVAFLLDTNVENLILSGFGNIAGTGNAGNNSILGNSGANVLTGNAGNDYLDGKTGADQMIGGTGNDTYVIDNAGDSISEVGGSGTDTIITKFTTTLSTDFENLTLTGVTAIDGTGNGSNNVIVGNGGANNLSGLGGADSINGDGGADRISGGAGIDTMTGGLGADTFVFAALTDSTNSFATADSVTDFSDLDVLDVSGIDAIFTGAGDVTDQAFNLVNSSATNLAAGNLAWSIASGVATIKLFTDADTTTDANMIIKLTLASSQTSLDFGDFVF